MPDNTRPTGVWDNHKRGQVGDFLRGKIRPGARLSFVSAYFTIYAYAAMRDTLEGAESLRFLFGEPRFVRNLDPEKTDRKAFDIEDARLQLRNRLAQRRVAADCADWIRRKADIRSVRWPGFLHGKMYHIDNAGVQEALLGSSNFTVSGLGGAGRRNNIELNLEVNDNRDRRDLLAWFDEIWDDPDVVEDVKDEVLRYLDQLYANHSPEFIYFKTLYHLFEDYLKDADKGGLLDGKTGFFETDVWAMLYDFQKDGVKGAINKILKHNGCIVADSVGLGKTFEALAVIKYFELRNERVLVLCPKKLEDNWRVYRENDTRNPLLKDRFAYTVMAHTDLGRACYDTHHWGNYGLVVIDESHNFRNNTPGARRDDGSKRLTRYEFLMEQVLRQGVGTKTLLLSATPVNNNLRDLRNQLYLVTANCDDAFRESLGVHSVAQTMQTAQTRFTNWADPKRNPGRQTAKLLDALDASFFKLLDELTIARSRKHIVSYYGVKQNAPRGAQTVAQASSLCNKTVAQASSLCNKKAAQASSLPDYLHKQDACATSQHKQDACATEDACATVFFNPWQDVDIIDRRLPHWRQDGVMYFVTYRLADALPRQKLEQLRHERETWDKTHREPLSAEERVEYRRLFTERVEQWLDAGSGSCCLADDTLARTVANALKHFDGERYRLDEWVVMPNHVHVLVVPLGEHTLSDILHTWKSYTATQINRILGRKDKPVWQHESYDHIVRSETELAHFRRYIHENPQKARVTVAQASSLCNKTVAQASSLCNKKVEQASSLPDYLHKQDACATSQHKQDACATSQHKQDACATSQYKQDACATDACATAAATPLAEGFPERLKVMARSPVTDLKGYFPTYDELNELIKGYKLTIFNPSAYLEEEHVNLYIKEGQLALFNDQKQREFYLIGMMRVNYLKRLESSVHSFEISIERTIGKIRDLLDKIDHFETNLDDYTQPDLFDQLDENDLDALNERLTVGRKLEIKLEHLDRKRWKADLKKDLKQLIAIHEKAAAITPDRDAKLQELKTLIAGKTRNPINPGNRKTLVFTAFADTAAYLYAHIEAWARDELGLHVALVTGAGENRTTFKPAGFARQSDFSAILANFAPRAKYREKMGSMPQDGEIDILIATDCISEGQNLQDCDYLINYDIHWNPVRIIQRFGRIDRLGSVNRRIQLVNFWPTPDLNKYINLKDRVEARMALVDIAATGADNLLDPDQLRDLVQEELTYRERQLLRLKDEVIDLEDMDDNVSLSEFTLDDFRIELTRFLDDNRKRLEDAPLGLYALVPTPESVEDPGLFDRNWHEIVKPGVVFCLRHKNPSTEQSGSRVNPLGAHYLLYLRDDGTVRFNFTQAKNTLGLLQKLCSGRREPYQALCDLFDSETEHGRDMRHYDTLLAKAVASIAAAFRKRVAAGLQSGRDFVIPDQAEQVKDDGDFELITWLVIKDCRVAQASCLRNKP
jgi:REP element-mobilizing transposase RayT